MDLSISYIYGEAWELAKKNVIPYLVYTLIGLCIGWCCVAFIMPSGFWSTYYDAMQGNTHAMQRMNQMQTFSPLQLIQYLVSAIVTVPLYNALIGVCRGTRQFRFDCIKVPAVVYCRYVVAYVLYVIIVLLASCLLIVPGVYLGIRLSFGGMYLIEHRESSIAEALRWSWGATRGRVLELFGLLLVGLIAIIALAVPCVIFVVALVSLNAVAGIVGLLVMMAAFFLWGLTFNMSIGMIYTTLCEK